MKFVLSSLAIALFTTLSPAFAQDPVLSGIPKLGQGPLRDEIGKVKGVKKLPVQGLSIIETTDGKVVLVSDNGRFAVVGGRWVDLFENKVITSIEDSSSLDKLNFARMGINVDDFEPITIGRGKKQVIAFMDPLCDQCRTMVRQMQSMEAEYTFKVVVLPFLSKTSAEVTTHFHCAIDRKLAFDAFLSNSYSGLPKPEKCDVSPIQKGLIAVRILGIKSVPFLILPDSTTASSIPKEMKLSQVLSQK